MSTAIIRNDIDYLRSAFSKFRIENVTQVNLRVQLADERFMNSNLLSFAIFNNKPEAIEYLLDSDMIDLVSCSKKSPTTLNTIEPPATGVSTPLVKVSRAKAEEFRLKSNYNSQSVLKPQSKIMNNLSTPLIVSTTNYTMESKLNTISPNAFETIMVSFNNTGMQSSSKF
jgi:hypothetical protein